MSRGGLRSLPVNGTSATRVLARLDGRVRNDSLSADLAGLPFESALTIREFFAWPGKRNYEGLWWSKTTRSHVAFESLLEREYLMYADHDADVVGIASQPFALLWSHGAAVSRSHVPDYFVRLAGGDGRVVDVRTERYVDRSQAQFDATRRLCEEVGWQYQVFTGGAGARLANLRWLSGYRADRFRPPDDAAPAILDAFCPTAPLAEGVRLASDVTGLRVDTVHAHVLHLLFDGLLRVDLDVPLSTGSVVSG